MSKYTPEELKTMARTVVHAEDKGDYRSIELIMKLSFKTGLNPSTVRQRIKALASGV